MSTVKTGMSKPELQCLTDFKDPSHEFLFHISSVDPEYYSLFYQITKLCVDFCNFFFFFWTILLYKKYYHMRMTKLGP